MAPDLPPPPGLRIGARVHGQPVPDHRLAGATILDSDLLDLRW
jgi:hypothetical protein